MSAPVFINIADIVDPEDPQGRTIRQINAAKGHSIPLGALVEVNSHRYPSPNDGIRLFVAYQGRDCDQTPLYWLSADRDDRELEQGRFFPRGWIGGYPEESLTVIRPSQCPTS